MESYGEGILFVLDREKLELWEKQQEVVERTEKIKSNARNADWKSHQITAKTLTPRKILIHTLSHLLMRELEYVCGYPISSLSERLYVSETMHGFLISAFDGTDGYLGDFQTYATIWRIWEILLIVQFSGRQIVLPTRFA